MIVTQTSMPAACRRATSARRWTAERERDDRNALGDRELELVVQAVVVEARLTEGDAEPLRLAPQRLGVRRERLRIDASRRRREDVHPERGAGQLAHRPDVVPHRAVARDIPQR